MKLSPEEKKIIDKMQPGVLTLNGFLGNDERHLHEIIEDDKVLIEKLGFSQNQIAERLQYFTDLSKEAYDDFILIDNKYNVSQEIWRGIIVCPFNHRGVFKKATIKLKNTENDLSVVWTLLHIHMIQEHCFFEGKGSMFRLDPETLIKAIF